MVIAKYRPEVTYSNSSIDINLDVYIKDEVISFSSDLNDIETSIKTIYVKLQTLLDHKVVVPCDVTENYIIPDVITSEISFKRYIQIRVHFYNVKCTKLVKYFNFSRFVNIFRRLRVEEIKSIKMFIDKSELYNVVFDLVSTIPCEVTKSTILYSLLTTTGSYNLSFLDSRISFISLYPLIQLDTLQQRSPISNLKFIVSDVRHSSAHFIYMHKEGLNLAKDTGIYHLFMPEPVVEGLNIGAKNSDIEHLSILTQSAARFVCDNGEMNLRSLVTSGFGVSVRYFYFNLPTAYRYTIIYPAFNSALKSYLEYLKIERCNISFDIKREEKEQEIGEWLNV